jgi:hypothetical protein
VQRRLTMCPSASCIVQTLKRRSRKSPKKKGEAVGGRPRGTQSQSAELSTDIPDDLSIPPFLRREQPKPKQPADATKPNESLPSQHDEQAQDVGFAAPQHREQPRRIDQLAHDPSPRFDHAMALEFYNATRPNGLVLGYTDGRPIADANQFERIAKEADHRGEHFFFTVATLNPNGATQTHTRKARSQRRAKTKP